MVRSLKELINAPKINKMVIAEQEQVMEIFTSRMERGNDWGARQQTETLLILLGYAHEDRFPHQK